MGAENVIADVITESARTENKLAAALGHIIEHAAPIIRERMAVGRTSDEAAADILSGLYWLKTDSDRAKLAALGNDLVKYAADCVDARYWGGPTIHPHNPMDERRAAEIGKLIQDWMK